jgi:hypothetical protein
MGIYSEKKWGIKLLAEKGAGYLNADGFRQGAKLWRALRLIASAAGMGAG